MENEEWRPIPGLSRHEASSMGRVRCKKKDGGWKILSGQSRLRGYCVVKIMPDSGSTYKNMRVHRLVCLAFGVTGTGNTVNHKDGNKLNNALTNLEMVSIQENLRHALETGLMKHGTAVKGNKLSEREVRSIARLLKMGALNNCEIASCFDVSPATIDHIAAGRKWKRVLKEMDK